MLPFFIIAQETDTLTITPSTVSLNDFTSYSLTWEQEVIEPSGTKRKGVNIIIDKAQVHGANIHRSLRWESTDGSWYEKADVLNKNSLAPVSIDIRWSPNYVQHTDFKDGTVISTSLDNSFSDSEVSVTTLEDPGFTWSSDGFTLISAIGKSSNVLRLITVNGLPHLPVPGTQLLEFLESEQLDIPQIGMVDARKFSILNSNTKSLYWLSESAPYIVKVQFTQPSGQVTTWVPKEFSILPEAEEE